jgi:hypothetical protein
VVNKRLKQAHQPGRAAGKNMKIDEKTLLARTSLLERKNFIAYCRRLSACCLQLQERQARISKREKWMFENLLVIVNKHIFVRRHEGYLNQYTQMRRFCD